jgi:DNA topoisomerase-1
MIVYRTGTKDGFVFKDSKDKIVKDGEILDYIKKLVIPPNYRDVKIFYQKTGQPKILFQGYDSKNRLQRIYSETWTKKAARKKFCELLNFAEQIQKIATDVKKHMCGERHTKSKMIAMIIRLVMICYFRIGNKKYQELYGSFGAMNIKKSHVKFKKDANGTNIMHISFIGKKGVFNSCDVTDTQLISEMKKLLKFRDDDDMVFQWSDHGVLSPIRAIDINHWLNTYDPVITSKDFRTYDANIFLIIFLRAQLNPSNLTQTQRKKIITSGMHQISEKIHNTPAVLKKNYTVGGIVDMYIKEPNRFTRYFLKDDAPRQAFIKYLRDYCKDYISEKEDIVKNGGRGIRS